MAKGSKKVVYEASDALTAMKEKMSNNGSLVTMDKFKNHSISHAQDSTYEKGTILIFPETAEDCALGMDTFKVTGRDPIEIPYIWVDTEAHGMKKVFLSQLARTVVEYEEDSDGDFVPKDSEPVHGEGELFEAASKAHDAGELLELVLGKRVEVEDVKPAQAPRYTNGVITGVRKARVACFAYAE